jgi:PKD repeat protein
MDTSIGEVDSWYWEFGDGESSTDRNPIHYYQKGGVHYNVTLRVHGPKGEDIKTRFWEVMVE